jgi:ABC-type transport system involved in cytochrome bd biosynthesis fused ATPase/permease subunit
MFLVLEVKMKYLVDGISFVGDGRVYAPGDEIDDAVFKDAKKVASLIAAGKLKKVISPPTGAEVSAKIAKKLATAQKAYDAALEAWKAAQAEAEAAQSDAEKTAAAQKEADAGDALKKAEAALEAAKADAA